jgi:hypothetical protein
MDFLKYFSYYSQKVMISPYYFGPPVLIDPVLEKERKKYLVIIRGDQEGLFKLVMLNFIFKWYSWSNFRLFTASH